jgi:AbrB family looped-hinge helix DNA binding protein
MSRIGQRREVVIPKTIFDKLHLEEGDVMEVTAEHGRLAMKRKNPVDADEVLMSSEAQKLRHALKQVRAGKTRGWLKIKHELGL